ncbi:zinc transporter, ZIP family [Thermoanaerobacter thermohydrosulfuricus]|uniref:Zinc/iron permease n=4 Tax=Thermoanaerobacter TaxID=1754 RepID=G2MW01_9THEO|nr:MULTISPECIES: ZIP family metal transporter [Thermoanaerobacter]AEM77664.1 zinc/iron permease [Thermoanaerobacter wiegelii Rt8.B1]EIW00361.1 putative divalent heavy-metal cations transporter [Thermoanaerobacter siderophilus SR4]EMT39391.1 putative divalent heavy-metal cations transporter [Thermoanaerobacter thermohydrosulfuricus WC1]UZQ83153.1 ZIP family metal transporter [Thermoanaerobacter sp. RKWS2]SDF98657.1 zinc transporter, ZIP family [Thermoanaerobacter thermohydrosulfuricus]
MSTFNAMIIGSLVGVIGTGLGGAATYFFKNPSARFFSGIMGITAGLMLSIVVFDLLPHAFDIAGLALGTIGILIGAILISFFDMIIENMDIAGGFIKEGVLLGIAIALHNFPEGLAVGSGFMVSQSLGINIALVIALHDFPEGLAMATPFSAGGIPPYKNVIYTVLAGIPTGIGALIGVLTGGISPYFIGLNLGIAGGAMLYVTCGDIIPEARNIYKGEISILGMILGIIGGIIITKHL